MVTYTNQGNPISKDAIALLKQFMGVSLPKDYEEFLSTIGGGRPSPDNFSFFETDGGSVVNGLYGLLRNDANDFVSCLRILEGRIHPFFISIGDDVFGNQICLALKGPDRGKIYFWDHEFEADDDEEPSMKNMTLIANSFTDFITSLHEYPHSNEE